MTLEQLSAAATQGEWVVDSINGFIFVQRDPLTKYVIAEMQSSVMENEVFICALVNLYRTGQLVAVADDVIERIAELERALEPFARHVGKVDAPVTLKIGNDTWTGTLTGADFANASHVLSLRNPSYRDCLAAKGTGDE